MRRGPVTRAIGMLAAAAIALAAGALPATASADSVTAPQVFVRLVDPNNATVGTTQWQPLSATLSSMGPYDIGVALQSTAGEYNRQAVEVDIASEPGGPVPSAWSSTLDPYAPYCHTVAGAPGTIVSTAALLYFHGTGTYALDVSMYTDAQHNGFPGSTCSGGPTTPVNLTVNATPSIRMAGTPLVPRTTRKAHGDNGPVLTMPTGAGGYNWRCARDPVLGPDGAVTGTPATSGSDNSGGDAGTFPISEADAFSGPGRWACSTQALGGDIVGNLFGTPWVTTPTITVKGEFVRDQARTSLRRLAHGRMRLTIPAIKTDVPAAAHGKLTVRISRATCVSANGMFRLHKALSHGVVLNGAGRGSFTFISPRQPGFYLGQISFGGTPLILPGRDADMFLAIFSPAKARVRPTLQFVSENGWDPCA